MNEEDRLNLKKLIGTNEEAKTTEHIRKVKHSGMIKEQVQILSTMKSRYARLSKTNPSEFDMMCKSKCSFLYDNYTDIYNKIKKDQLDLKLLAEFLAVLKDIEDGNIDEHDGSFKVGSILKKIYIDSALNKQPTRQNSKPTYKKNKNISWAAYKNKFLTSEETD
tara:strand:+ start:31057 stop:31548 length:492 start_codon:yes stop_codon:yes gene_type:complete